MRTHRNLILLLILGNLMLAFYVGTVVSLTLIPDVGIFLTLYGFLFFGFIGALFLVQTLPFKDNRILLLVGGFAILFRLIMFVSEPSLSDDCFRYLWDGHMSLSGINPYLHAPNDPTLLALRTPSWEYINHPGLRTIYPPFAQLVFLVARLAGDSPLLLKTILLLFDGALFWALLGLLKETRRSPLWIIAWAWNPLVIIETFGSAHIEMIAISLLCLSYLFLSRGRETLFAFFYSASVLTLYLPLCLLPFIWKKVQMRSIFLIACLLMIAYLPFLSAGFHLFESFTIYLQRWEFNSPIYFALKALTGDPLKSRYILSVLFFIGVSGILLKRKGLFKSCFWTLGLFLFFTPTFYPWYLLWIAPWLCLFPSPAWVALTGLSMLSYWVLPIFDQQGQWILTQEILILEFLPFGTLLLWGWRKSRRKGALRHS